MILGELLAGLFPSPCTGCGAPLPWGRGDALPLCLGCASALRTPPASACRSCGRPLAALPPGSRCGSCLAAPPAWDELVAAYLYVPPLDSVIRALKFGRAEFLGVPLARALADRCTRWSGAAGLVVPVPLPWTRLLLRGFNQAEAIARPLADHLGLPCRPLLRRRLRRRQATLGRAARRRNLAGAFAVGGSEVAGATVILVDDVMTTGATLAAAAAALRAGGAARVVAAVAARTPERSWLQAFPGRPDGEARGVPPPATRNGGRAPPR